MKTAIIAVAGLAAAASAQSFVADLSGITVDAASPTVLMVTNNNSGPLTTIDFDITVDAGVNGANASWGSEVFIGLTHLPSGFTFTADGNDIDLTDDGPNDLLFGWDNAGGIFSFQGSVDLTGALADVNGDWEVVLADQFDDFGPDHQYLQGSTITINNVPAPAGMAILGLGGLAAARRRR
jgi:hypothetical protein